MSKITIPEYSLSEEIINAITHGIGAIFSIVALVVLIIKASSKGSLALTCAVIYGISLILLYTISTIYHSLSKKLIGKKVLRVIDHCNVYLLVYATIIPVTLLGITGKSGWICFSITSLVTLIGITLTCINIEKTQVLEVICHLINGWSILLYLKPLIANITTVGVLFIFLGGVVYSLGAILYGLGVKKKYMHSIFHVFCLIATILHFIAIYNYIL